MMVLNYVVVFGFLVVGGGSVCGASGGYIMGGEFKKMYDNATP